MYEAVRAGIGDLRAIGADVEVVCDLQIRRGYVRYLLETIYGPSRNRTRTEENQELPVGRESSLMEETTSDLLLDFACGRIDDHRIVRRSRFVGFPKNDEFPLRQPRHHRQQVRIGQRLFDEDRSPAQVRDSHRPVRRNRKYRRAIGREYRRHPVRLRVGQLERRNIGALREIDDPPEVIAHHERHGAEAIRPHAARPYEWLCVEDSCFLVVDGVPDVKVRFFRRYQHAAVRYRCRANELRIFFVLVRTQPLAVARVEYVDDAFIRRRDEQLRTIGGVTHHDGLDRRVVVGGGTPHDTPTQFRRSNIGVRHRIRWLRHVGFRRCRHHFHFRRFRLGWFDRNHRLHGFRRYGLNDVRGFLRE